VKTQNYSLQLYLEQKLETIPGFAERNQLDYEGFNVNFDSLCMGYLVHAQINLVEMWHPFGWLAEVSQQLRLPSSCVTHFVACPWPIFGYLLLFVDRFI
jgi:hypothetical protein